MMKPNKEETAESAAEAFQSKPRHLVRDPEIQALARLDEVIAGLTPEVAERVLRWLVDRHLKGTILLPEDIRKLNEERTSDR